ncbi:MAG TPA: response regulator [Gemmatales bacterium]|nr:response regulator [Gemmatales bacterium]HMP57832.1 response regulator [Gemmatales bacterium]
MDHRRIKLLHVEDNLAHRRLIGHYLSAMKDFEFDVFHADSEEAAVESFRTNGIQIVLLDFHLTQGDGLSCLRRLRSIDPLVPIVALSGAATPEIASELLEVGADDYLSKQDLNREALATAVRNVLSRVDLVRKEGHSRKNEVLEQLDADFDQACQSFLKSADPNLVAALDKFESSARNAKITVWELQQVFTRVCEKRAQQQPSGQPPVEKFLRPLLLESVLRLFGSLPFAR